MRSLSRRHPAGLAYVEILVAAVLLAVAIVPAMDALTGGIASPSQLPRVDSAHRRAADRLEEVLAQPLASLDAAATAAGAPGNPSSYSDAAGTASRRLVFLSRYDGDNADGDNDPFTGTDGGLVWVRVQIEGTGTVLTTLTAR